MCGADNLIMNDLMSIIKAVLLNKKVIIAAIACFLMMDFASYVCRYRKKPAQKKVKKAAAPVQQASEENAAEEGADGEGDE